jgi:hypothetical protein
MAKCSGIKDNGGRCGSMAMKDSQYCYYHDPSLEETRQRNNRKGGRRGGKGRPQVEIRRLMDRIEEIAEGVLDGSIEKSRGSIAGQLLNYCLRGISISLEAREQEELVQRLEVLEEGIQEKKRSRQWGA